MTPEIVHKKEIDLFSKDKVELLKRTICRGADDNEFQLFLHACQRTGLDPFMRQIHAVKRYDSSQKREVMSIQTGIDGYRLIADRSGNYVPGRETSFQYDKEGRLVSATSYVKKRTSDGQWHEISATAFYSEYVATTKDGTPNKFWREKAHIMLAKCSEALALRRAFPGDLSGIYTAEEMEQASNPPIDVKPKITEEQEQMLANLIESDEDPEECAKKLLAKCQSSTLGDIHPDKFDKALEWLSNRIDAQKKFREEQSNEFEEAAM